jgi:uroporphyrinogen decarboxylase
MIYHEEPDRVPVSPRLGARFIPWLYPSQDVPYWRKELQACIDFKFDCYVDGMSPPGLMGIPLVIGFHPSSHVPPGIKDVSLEVQSSCLDADYIVVTRIIRTPKGVLRDRIKVPKQAKFDLMRERWRTTCSSNWMPDPYPFIVEHLVKSIEDVDKLIYLLPDVDKVDEKGIEGVRTGIGDRGLVSYSAGSPIDDMVYTIGLKEAIIAYFRNRSLLEATLKVLHEHTLALTESLLERGAEIIYLSAFMGSPSAGWSPKMWRSLFKPRIAEQRSLVRKMGGLFHFYDDGRIMDILKDLGEMHIDILTLAPDRFGNDLAKVKAEMGDHTCLKAGIDPDVVRLFDSSRVMAETRRSIENAGSGGGFILSSSDSLHAYTPFENIEALVETAKKYGKYPLRYG